MKNNITAILLTVVFTANIQSVSAQGFLGKLKKTIKTIETTANTITNTMNGAGDVFAGKNNTQNHTSNNANSKNVETNTRQNQSATSISARPAKITAQSGSNHFTVTDMVINNVGMGMPIVRLHDSGIFLSNTGISLIGKISMEIMGMSGKRLIMMLTVLDENGHEQADNNGSTSYLTPIQVTSSNYSCELEVRIPYTWINLEKRPSALNFEVSLLDFTTDNEHTFIGESIISIDPASVSVNGDAAHNQMINDILGGGGIGGMDLGDLMGTMFGGSDTAEHTCMKCDGTGVCEYCDGDGFLDPSLCRKCAHNPGICRSCNGTGTTTVKLDIDKSWW